VRGSGPARPVRDLERVTRQLFIFVRVSGRSFVRVAPIVAPESHVQSGAKAPCPARNPVGEDGTQKSESQDDFFGDAIDRPGSSRLSVTEMDLSTVCAPGEIEPLPRDLPLILERRVVPGRTPTAAQAIGRWAELKLWLVCGIRVSPAGASLPAAGGRTI
jgi:hypothetical protein